MTLGFRNIKLGKSSKDILIYDGPTPINIRQSLLDPNGPDYALCGIDGEFQHKGSVKGIKSSAGALVTPDGIRIHLKGKGKNKKAHAGKQNESNFFNIL